jgi:hypothetical protein
LHQLECEHIPEESKKEKKRNQNIKNLILKVKKRKKQQKKEEQKFFCPYDGCQKQYYSYSYSKAIEHLEICDKKNDQKKIEYLKTKGMLK